MKRYLVEREIPGVGSLDRAQLKKLPLSQTMCSPGFPEECNGSNHSLRATRLSVSTLAKTRIWFSSTPDWADFQ